MVRRLVPETEAAYGLKRLVDTFPGPFGAEAEIERAEGDIVEATFSRGKIILTPKTVIDRAALPTADVDYTPAQRQAIDARLAGARKGPYFGPFATAEEMIASMKGQLKKRAAIKKTKRPR